MFIQHYIDDLLTSLALTTITLFDAPGTHIKFKEVNEFDLIRVVPRCSVSGGGGVYNEFANRMGVQSFICQRSAPP